MKLNKNLIYFSKRFFAPPKAAAGKGGPAAAPTAPPVVIQKTPFQRMIEKGVDFPLGPPKSPNFV
jgi:hypothetical protein